MSLTSFLPAPRNTSQTAQHNETISVPVEAPRAIPLNSSQQRSQQQTKQVIIPPYGHRKGWTPRTIDDFRDGGAFPEIHVAQYPLDMGRKDKPAVVSSALGLGGGTGGPATLAVTVDEDGKVDYTKVVNAAHDLRVQGKHKDLVASVVAADDLRRPEPEEEAKTAERTKAALERIVEGKVAAANPHNVQDAALSTSIQQPTFVRYTPANAVAGIKERVIRLSEVPQDPLEPAKFKYKIAPPPPGETPVPVMHSPPKKLSTKELADWKIPPCISNWKNNKGYTIALDKRLAADGRGLQEVVVNDNFAKFAESLYIAERNAREQVAKRAELEKALKLKEKEAKEERLRQLAEEARKEREQAQQQLHQTVSGGGGDHYAVEEDPALVARRERDQIRKERQREIERDLRIQRNRSQASRNADRDITEKVALGLAVPKTTGEASFDQRLFNQSEGLSSGFGDEDSYNVYTKPLFGGSSASQIYRPKKGDSEAYGSQEDYQNLLDTSKFRPDKGFSGAEPDKQQQQSKGGRDKPVEFERQPPVVEQEADPFGIDEFLHTAKGSGKSNPLDKIGKTGHMHAASAGGTGGGSSEASNKRSRINFESSDESNKRRRQ